MFLFRMDPIYYILVSLVVRPKGVINWIHTGG